MGAGLAWLELGGRSFETVPHHLMRVRWPMYVLQEHENFVDLCYLSCFPALVGMGLGRDSPPMFFRVFIYAVADVMAYLHFDTHLHRFGAVGRERMAEPKSI